MRLVLRALVVVAVGAASLALPASPVSAIDPPAVRVTPGVSSVVLGETRQLTANVSNLTNTAVTWSVRSGAGSVSATGLYTPPAQLPPTPVSVVRAASVEDPSVYGEATVAIASGVPGGAFGPELPTGTAGGQDADMGDINGDGRTDVVMFQNCCNGLSVGHLVTLRWDGTSLVRGGPSTAVSTFQENGFTSTTDHLLDIELGDVDGDGDLDVYVPFGATQSQYWRYQVWRNDGTGTFTPDARVRTTGGARSGARARLTDFDGDGKLDAVRMEWYGTMLLEKGNGDGTFQEPIVLMSTSDADSFDIGDLTGDGRPEIAVGIKGMSNSSTTIEVGINNGFGGIASEVTYNVGMAPEPRIADTDGDGWNDLVVGIGGEQYTHFAPRLMAHKNLATGTGAVAATGVELLNWRPRGMEAVHVDADGVLDLAAFTYRGPVLLRRTAANAYAATHAAIAGSIHHATFGDVTGDGRLDTFTNFDNSSQFWPGSADGTLTFAVRPGVTRINATHTAAFSALLRNSSVEPKLTWSASRGTFNDATYTAPATAAPSGTPVTITAALTGTTSTATRAITVVNDKFQFTSLGGQQVRQVVTDPQQPTHLYAATATGVYRSTTNGVSFSQLGTTATTGTDARQLAVVRDPMGTLRVLAVFGTTLYRINVDAGDWLPASAPAGVATVSVAPNTPVVWIAAGGAVHRSTDGGTGWASLGQTSVTRVEAIDDSNAWLLRSVAPRVSRGTVVTAPSLALNVTARELPVPAATVNTIAVHPTNRTLAYVATNDAANPLFRDAGGTGNEGSPMWAAVPTPGVVDRLSVSGSGVVLAARATTLEMYKSTDEGAAWHSINRGFTSVSAQTVAHRSDGLDLVGTSAGLYTPVESMPPAAPAVTAGPSGTTGPGTANSFSFTFDAVADAASYLCALDDKSWAACTSPKAYSGPLASGSHTFSVVALDANGNESAPGTRTWTVDATPPPVPSILTGPTGTVNTTTAAFTFDLPGDATGATCALDAATPVSCASGVSYSSLGQGAHTFSVRSVDAVGNASAPATRAWTVDSVPPAFPHFYQTPAWVSPWTTAFFQWQSEAGATYTCTLDAAPVACTSSSASLSGLTEGGHTFRVTATDAAANSTYNAYDWTVDLTNPSPPVISVKPPASTALTTAHFEFASPSTDVSYYWCYLDGTPQYCYGTADYANLAVGTHTFAVKAFDQADRQSTLTEYQWTIAVPPPVISGGPTGLVNTRTASFTFTAVDGATTQCALDGATPAPCASGVTYNAVADGPHTFSVTATKNGATSAAATRSWTVDATAPAAPELTAVPPLRTTSGVATFGWTVDPALTYTCALDGVDVACGSGTYQKSDLGQGAHQFVLTVRDAATNANSTSYSWTVDQTGPTVSLSTKPAARTAQTSATFEFGAAAGDLHHYVCTVDGVAAECTSPRVLTSLGQGAHTFSVVAYDDLGNAGNTASHSWTVDTSGPAVTLTGKPPARTTLTTATFTFSSSAADLAGYVCTIDGVTSPCTSPRELSSLAPGSHTFSVVAKDDLGNVGTAATHSWTIDQTGPAVTLSSTPPARTNLSTATFQFASTAPDVAGYRCTLDGRESACTSPLQLSSLAQGPHSFAVVAVDDLGNAGAPATHTWTVDQTGPTVAMSAKPAARTAQTSATFEFASAATDVHHYVCTVDGVAANCTSPRVLTSLGQGAHTFSVVAYDDLGNAGNTVSHSWTVDTTGPAVTLTGKPPAKTALTTATFTFSSSAADLAGYVCTVDGVTNPCASPLELSSLSLGTHTFSVVAKDDLGNVGTAATHTWTIDQSGPPVTLSAAPPVRTTVGTATFEFSSGAADVAGFRCTVDGVEDACTSPLQLTSLAPGQHSFAVVAVDELGNAGAPATHAWTVDQTGPALTMPVKPAARTSQTFARFEFSTAAADLHHYACTLDGVVTDPCASPVERVGLAAGEHTFSVVAYDDLGNAGAPVTHTWVVDVTAPDVTITVKPPAWSNDATPAFEFSSSAGDVAGYHCTLDGTAMPCASPWTDIPTLAEGPHTLSVVAVDDARNVGTTPATHTWTTDLTEPGAGIATPSASLAPSHAVTFTEPVKGVSGTTVRLLLTGTATAVPASVGCRTAAGAAVTCGGDTVRRAVLAPTAPLTPGQLYTIDASGLTDLAGNAAEPVTAAYRASVSEQESGLASAPAWRKATSSLAKGGSYHLSDANGASASYAFTGTSVTWYGLRGPTFGLADVYVDGKLKASKVNFYSTSTASVAKSVTGLTNAKHTLKIVVRGERGSTAGKGTFVAVDAVKVGATVTSSPALAFTWGRTAATPASGGAYGVEDSAGATFTLKFRGRGIDWVTVTGPSMGKASVSIDGVSKGTFDNWASATKYGVVRRFGGLTDTVHTLKITVLGTRRSGATGTNVAVDRFGILA